MGINSSKNNRILVAMSGGVDSAITAYLLKQQGFEVTGIHFIMDPRKIESQQEAETMAKFLGIKFLVKDVSKQFSMQVLEYFIKQYCFQLTPNPCVMCNPLVKFSNLLMEADSRGITYVATGHYAKVQKADIQGTDRYFLSRARDAKKDQSYFLYRLSEAQLSRILFPLGEYIKEEIKEIARQINLKVCGCFLILSIIL